MAWSDNIVRLASIDSTSLEARRRLSTLSGATVFVAAAQRGGVGQHGRPWQSPVGGLWLTIAAPTAGDAELAIKVSGVVCALIAALGVEGASIKWPNDVLIHGRKVAGVLVEMTSAGGRTWALIGVGVNVNFARTSLAPVLQSSATTLLDELGREVDLAALERGVIEGVGALIDPC